MKLFRAKSNLVVDMTKLDQELSNNKFISKDAVAILEKHNDISLTYYFIQKALKCSLPIDDIVDNLNGLSDTKLVLEQIKLNRDTALALLDFFIAVVSICNKQGEISKKLNQDDLDNLVNALPAYLGSTRAIINSISPIDMFIQKNLELFVSLNKVATASHQDLPKLSSVFPSANKELNGNCIKIITINFTSFGKIKDFFSLLKDADRNFFLIHCIQDDIRKKLEDPFKSLARTSSFTSLSSSESSITPPASPKALNRVRSDTDVINPPSLRMVYRSSSAPNSNLNSPSSERLNSSTHLG